MKNLWIGCVMLALSSPLLAQRGAIEPTQDVAASKAAAYAQLYEKLVGEVRARTAVEGRITTGAPYSAEAVTESTQALADGNRISRKSLTRVFRDGEGRTRREEVDDSGTVVSVSIVDPVAHVTYVLNPSSRTAYRDGFRIAMPGGRGTGADVMRRAPEGVASAPVEVQSRVKIAAEELAKTTAAASPVPPPPPPPPPSAETATMKRSAADATTREDLGSQTVEGVTAAGSRSTTTIPAGAIGNLQPIKVVVEQWFSPDLQVLVMTKHSDPRSGETTYRLQNIVRAEPDRSLFTLPPDYTLKESGIREPQMK
jgi:hypothetical protein